MFSPEALTACCAVLVGRQILCRSHEGHLGILSYISCNLPASATPTASYQPPDASNAKPCMQAKFRATQTRALWRRPRLASNILSSNIWSSSTNLSTLCGMTTATRRPAVKLEVGSEKSMDQLTAELRREVLALKRENAQLRVKLIAADEKVISTERRAIAEREAATDAERRKAAINLESVQNDLNVQSRSCEALQIALEEERLISGRARSEAAQHKTHANVLQRKLLHAQSHLYGAHLQLETFASKAPPRVLREVCRVSELGGHALPATQAASSSPVTSALLGATVHGTTTSTPASSFPFELGSGGGSGGGSGAPWAAGWSSQGCTATPATLNGSAADPRTITDYGRALNAARDAEWAGRPSAPREAPHTPFDNGGTFATQSRFDEYVKGLRDRSRGLVQLSEIAGLNGTPSERAARMVSMSELAADQRQNELDHARMEVLAGSAGRKLSEIDHACAALEMETPRLVRPMPELD